MGPHPQDSHSAAVRPEKHDPAHQSVAGILSAAPGSEDPPTSSRRGRRTGRD